MTVKKVAKKSTKTSKKKLSVDSLIEGSGINHDYRDVIHLKWVKTHNLKNIDISIPKNKLVTVTGVSGSGKSSLAFHTLYKEGQFRYIESLSSYLRQFFNLWTRPELEMSSGLSPAIAIEQNKSIGSSRSTVWTITEIDDYVRLLYAKIGDMYSYGSGKKIQPQSVEQIMEAIRESYEWEKIYLLKYVKDFDEVWNFEKFVKKNRNRVERGKGFTRYLIVGKDTTWGEETSLDPIEFFYLETPNVPEKYFSISVYGIYDRVTIEDKRMDRLKEDVIKILTEVPKFGVYIDQWEEEIDPTKEMIRWFTDKNYDPDFDISYPTFSSQHFSPNRQEWACPCCHGLGEVLQVDYDKVLDGQSSYLEAILPWRDSKLGQAILKKLAHKHDVDVSTNWSDLPERFLHTVLYGDKELLKIPMGGGKYISMKYKGVEDVLRDQYTKWLLTVDFQAMLDMAACPECHGARLRKESLHVMLELPQKLAKSLWNKEEKTDAVTDVLQLLREAGLFNIHDIHQMSIAELVIFFEGFQSSTKKAKVLVDRIINPLLDRIKTIDSLWLGYLTLGRGVKTLSGWEVQRLRLAKQLWNKLTGILYVLDEPTIGLDNREIERMTVAIRQLQEMGNSIVVVEHHDKFIEASDWVIEIWPGAGDFWWHVEFNGPYADFIKSHTLTAQYMRGEKVVDVVFDHEPQQKSLRVKKASKYNLKSVDVSIDLWSFTIITWPSGAGKTTLMYTTLYRFLHEKEKFIQSFIRLRLLKEWLSWQQIIAAPVMDREKYQHMAALATQDFYEDIGVESILWYDEIKNIVYVDQSSIGKTPRSCPATFIGVFDDIRKLFAWSKDSKYLWFTTGHFSFNSAKWSCPGCKGYGYKKIELQFLPDTYVPCEICKGKRYKPEILDIKRRGVDIYEVLDMYVSEALEFFSEMDHIHRQLFLMNEIGLGYLKMGQPAHMLSGWESQRLKLVKHLLKSYKWHTMYFLDEPTVGLHMSDTERLLRVIKRFLDDGDTVVMIEHDEHLLKFADKVIRLQNGEVVS